MTGVCDRCHLVHELRDDTHPTREAFDLLHDCFDAQRAAMLALLEKIGNPGICHGFRAAIVWVRHANGKAVPYTHAGLNHFIDCPDRERFKKAK